MRIAAHVLPQMAQIVDIGGELATCHIRKHCVLASERENRAPKSPGSYSLTYKLARLPRDRRLPPGSAGRHRDDVFHADDGPHQAARRDPHTGAAPLRALIGKVEVWLIVLVELKSPTSPSLSMVIVLAFEAGCCSSTVHEPDAENEVAAVTVAATVPTTITSAITTRTTVSAAISAPFSTPFTAALALATAVLIVRASLRSRQAHLGALLFQNCLAGQLDAVALNARAPLPAPDRPRAAHPSLPPRDALQSR